MASATGHGFSAQIPLPRALERDERYIRQWVREEWPRIQARAGRTGATILFLDESCQESFPNVRRTWTPAGSRPEKRNRHGNRQMLNLISAVSPDGALFFDIREESIDGMRVLWFLERLLEGGGRSADGDLCQRADIPVGGGDDVPVGASTAVGDAKVPAVCAGAGPRRTSVDRPQVSAVGEPVPEDGGRDSCRSRTRATIDAGAPRAGRLL